ncbi:hypothetical protein GA0074692_1087 [Micromonospora pallida]|uniref:Uncharacterized protein n=1 Tax=Micromonospora pallida TaxID=145854 RepID=A0A1C6RV55_9ACTN|nr:hypothetical protein [Micromonospora pallida]SCL21108.1 hypothetical protein GA0074692_1087 [Micromonospora pallida]
MAAKAHKLDKVVKPSWAARVLCIDHSDLPKLDRPWTKGDVRELRDSNPAWLTEARQRYATRRQQESETRMAELAAEFARLGYDEPDQGTLDQAMHYIDGARTHLMIATDCSETEADRAAWRVWPKSMAAEDADHENQLNRGVSETGWRS